MKLRVQLEWRDYLEATLLNMRPTPLGRIILWLLALSLACGLVMGLIMLAQGLFAYETIAPALVLGGIYAIYRYVVLPNRIRHLFSQQKALASPTEVELTDGSLRLTG